MIFFIILLAIFSSCSAIKTYPDVVKVVQSKHDKTKCEANFQGKTYQCSLGENGVSSSRKEGDRTTPLGKFAITDVFYRNDKLKLKTKYKNPKIIQKNYGWGGDFNKNYNKFIIFTDEEIENAEKYKLNDIGNNERLWREYDDFYDIILVSDFNKEGVHGKGSAIFFHIKDNLPPTFGCVAFEKKDFIEMMSKVDHDTTFVIEESEIKQPEFHNYLGIRGVHAASHFASIISRAGR